MLRYLKTKWAILGAVAILLALGLSVPIVASGADPVAEVLRQVTQKAQGDQEVAVLVDGQPISRGYVRQITTVIQSNYPNLTEGEARKKALETIIRKKVQYIEAERRGLKASRDEAQKVTDEQRKIFQDSAPPSARQQLDVVLKNLGITEDEYWKQEVDAYAVSVTRGKLRQQVDKELPPGATQRERESHWEKYVDGLVSKAKIEYKDKTLP